MSNTSFPVSDDPRHLRSPDEQVVNPQGYTRDLSKSDDEADDEIDLRELFGVIMRRKGTIILIAILTFIAALVMTLMMKPVYRASTTLQVEMEGTKVLKYDVEAESGSRNARDFYQTQFEVLKSRALAKRTMEGMGIESLFRGDQLAKPFFAETVDGLKSLFLGSTDEDEVDPFAEESQFETTSERVGKAPLEDKLIRGLTVSPVKNSQIVKLSYDSTDPELAANIVNSIARNYIDMNLERRVESAGFAKEFLGKQLADVKSKLEQSQVELNDYLKEKGLFKLGDEKSPGLTATKITQLSKALGEAETKRIEMQSKYEQAQRAHGDAKVLDSPTVQALKKNLVNLQSKYQEQLQVYKPGYPLMVQLRRQMQQIENEIDAETRTIRQTVERSLSTDFLAAKENEAELAAELERQKQLFVEIRDQDIGYNTLFREVETNKSSYDGLLTRLKEVSVAGGVESNNISVLDPAIVPFAKHKPNTRLNLALGLVLGVFLGTVVAFLLEFLDDRVKTTDELERLLGLPLLGMTPSVKGDDPVAHALMTVNEPSSAIAEAFRSLRTNLLFASKLGLPRVLVLTSAMPSEGKSSSCVNLATAFAQANNRVLVVDADLRKPTAHKRLKLDNSVGLSNYLTSQAETADVIQESSISGVSVITAGPISPNPSELLTGERLNELFSLAPDTFDIIIVDAPPVMGLADALVLSNRADATVMVTAFAQSKKRQIQDANRRLRQAHANLIGVLFTKVKTGGSYGGYNYYTDYYSYGADHLPNKT
ncbi:GumC family protein [Leucothrix pacifica]|uniref:non-specific protein-tyrosine kinase n=1 Tax=Leucothrix pacifica TaxID=1247513 RepID=A0A317CBP3_9GAMM|nr:polysaccharide biosynthesis tyrosine autokinase [Leucothrix pacifica]PWQ95789.1 exopolysaccharide biosynthesis protein [Leucothrix pacifica]